MRAALHLFPPLPPQAALCRCSQPLTGFSARCLEDELLLQAILKVNEGSTALHVVDTRPMVNALANRAQGKGYESDQVYKNIRFRFFDIENIHVMRGSLEKLLKGERSAKLVRRTFCRIVRRIVRSILRYERGCE